MEKRKENSFRKIDTGLFLAQTRADLTGAGYKVLNVVIHFTLGYNQRTEAEISLSTFADYTGLSRKSVIKAIKLLEGLNIISRISIGDTTHRSNIYQLNTDFETWGTSILEYTSKGSKSTPERVQKYTCTSVPAETVTTRIKKERKPLKKTITANNNLVCEHEEPSTLKDEELTSIDQDNSFLESTEVETQSAIVCAECGKQGTEVRPIRFTEGGKPLCHNCMANLTRRKLYCSECGSSGSVSNPLIVKDEYSIHEKCASWDCSNCGEVYNGEPQYTYGEKPVCVECYEWLQEQELLQKEPF